MTLADGRKAGDPSRGVCVFCVCGVGVCCVYGVFVRDGGRGGDGSSWHKPPPGRPSVCGEAHAESPPEVRAPLGSWQCDLIVLQAPRLRPCGFMS